MTTNNTVKPFTGQLTRSWYWLLWVTLTHLSITIIFIIYLPEWSILLIGLMPFSIWRALRGTGWLHLTLSVQRIHVNAKGEMLIVSDQTIGYQPVKISGSSYITPLFILLNLRQRQKKLSVMIWPDSAPANFRHQLRVYLRWFPVPITQKIPPTSGQEYPKHP